MYERFYAGGFRSIRGFQFRGVGPFVNGFNVGGTFAFLNSLEYQIPIVPNDSSYVVGFVDSGTVAKSFTLDDYRVTAGVGLRISMPQLLGPVPIAIDFGFPIVKRPATRRRSSASGSACSGSNECRFAIANWIKSAIASRHSRSSRSCNTSRWLAALFHATPFRLGL